jgi:hypothetical protein
MITVITPTGDRHAAFNRCAQWVTSQSVRPTQWIIVDDGEIALDTLHDFPDWVTYIRREREAGDPPHTLSSNLAAALPEVRHDRIFIMEDDDWYGREYIEYLLPHLDRHDLVGLNLITYYHLLGRVWKTGKPKAHTALAQTAFTRRALPKLQEICTSGHWEVRERGLVDRHWWHGFDGAKHLIADHPRLHCGFKGLFGRAGIAEGHSSASWGYEADPELTFLRAQIGADIDAYRGWATRPKKPFAIYTAISGEYDALREPLHDNPLFDFHVFTDIERASNRWMSVPFDEAFAKPVRIAKKPKLLPHLYLPQYEWSIWIDANIFILEDLTPYVLRCIQARAGVGQFLHHERDSAFDEAEVCIDKGLDAGDVISDQMARYRREGFDGATGLFECNFLVRRHNDPNVIRLMQRWWKEVGRGSSRDQISYPYALWKEGLRVQPLAAKGVTVRTVPELYYSAHGPLRAREYDARIAEHRDRMAAEGA